MSRPVQRFGGVHESLSGARTMDITGHRATYELTLPWLTPVESRFVEALHQRTVPGPFWLLDPLASNRLTRDAAMLRPYTADVVASSGGIVRSSAQPAGLDVPVSSVEWSSYSAGASIALPTVPVLANETVTASIWARTLATATITVTMTFLGQGQAERERETSTVSLGSSWERIAVSGVVPADAVAARLTLTAVDGTRLTLAAAQIASDESATWDLGGGAPRVLLDQVGRSSPNYPRNDLTLTLLEV